MNVKGWKATVSLWHWLVKNHSHFKWQMRNALRFQTRWFSWSNSKVLLNGLRDTPGLLPTVFRSGSGWELSFQILGRVAHDYRGILGNRLAVLSYQTRRPRKSSVSRPSSEALPLAFAWDSVSTSMGKGPSLSLAHGSVRNTLEGLCTLPFHLARDIFHWSFWKIVPSSILL